MNDEQQNSFDDHEIIFKDKDGKLKVLKDGKIFDAQEEQEKKEEKPVAPKPEEKKADVNIPKELETHENILERGALDIAREAQIHLADETLKKRFTNLVISRFKDIRDSIEAREMLLKAKDLGGMGFSLGEADTIMKAMEERYKSQMNIKGRVAQEVVLIPKTEEFVTIKRQAKPLQPAPQEAPATKMGGGVPLKIEKNNEFSEARKDILKLIQEMPDYEILPGLSKNTPQKEPIPPIIPPIIVEEKKGLGKEPQMSLKEEKKSPTVAKPIEEKTAPPAQKPEIKLIGPVDELREVDITEFHRIDSDPVRACQRIKEKLTTLEQYSFAELARGIAAWRQSGVYKLYVDIGRMSIMGKIPVEEVIQDLKNQGKPYLTLNEFNAIMDLNEQIRF